MRIRFLCATVVASSMLTGCYTPLEEQEPQVQEIRYDTTHVLHFYKEKSEWRTVFHGSRCYTGKGNSSTDHLFKFDSDDDTLTLTINDNEGVMPGDDYSYTLSQINQSNAKTLQSWKILTQTPSSDTKAQHVFSTVISLSSDSKWDPAVEVQGLYVLSQTSRTLSVDTRFSVGNKVAALGFCSPRD